MFDIRMAFDKNFNLDLSSYGELLPLFIYTYIERDGIKLLRIPHFITLLFTTFIPPFSISSGKGYHGITDALIHT